MYWLLSALGVVLRNLPAWAVDGLGLLLGWIWFWLIPVRRRVALDNLRSAFPDWNSAKRFRTARACFVHLSRSALELPQLSGLTAEKASRTVVRSGWEHFEKAQSEGRGVVLAAAHLGNFDLVACSEALRGMPLYGPTRQASQKGVNRFWMQVRKRCGVGLLPTRNTAWRIHKLLGGGAVVGFMIDQHMPPDRGLAVDFFGRPASTTPAPAVFAVTTGAPLLPVSVERLGSGRHQVTFDAPVEFSKEADRRKEIERITLQLNRWLENRIREKPEQWLWVHRRWKLDGPTGPITESADC